MIMNAEYTPLFWAKSQDMENVRKRLGFERETLWSFRRDFTDPERPISVVAKYASLNLGLFDALNSFRPDVQDELISDFCSSILINRWSETKQVYKPDKDFMNELLISFS